MPDPEVLSIAPGRRTQVPCSSRRLANYPRLLALQRDLLTHYKCVTYVCDKRYFLMLMFLDYAVEPFYYERRQNFYADGQNYALASLAVHGWPHTLRQERIRPSLLGSFQRAVKEKSPQTLGDLVQPVQASDSCSMVLCMAGMFQGTGAVSELRDPFRIILTSFNSRGGINTPHISPPRAESPRVLRRREASVRGASALWVKKMAIDNNL